MLHWYQSRLASHPVLTQSITTALLFATGDTTAQQVVERRGLEGHDAARTARMALYGGTVFGPAATTWYRFLQKRVVLSTPRRTMLAQVACDQGLFAPVFISVFLSSMAVLEGSSPRENLDRNYHSALTANYAIWPAVQMINFSVVPLHHRVLFVNVVSIGWNSYLSYLNAK
ncbi:integral membrane protein mpv17 pmp22 family [Grosmannia clavigera kw1407]|uniref:Integral membrane protein mpv17 pmp22 family n=1 Tax=Grosmannia clavigera (strain kw1407 / UAMH 11150) TaxID=655863 RepID=F0XCH7_GROCL|nr:integral membrane protein mpv17 pmp22 family [Grosmannia clavigera kw1407]EFX03442.1 integral membrane protein mpv17 pmp22 family [Grosmannia clavigera kw1407]